MNGIHDIGGMDGFGPIVRETDEPVFHARWEGRMLAIVNALAGAGVFNVDEFRHAIERIPPARYLATSYYEHWLDGIERLLSEKGVARFPGLDAAAAQALATRAAPRVRSMRVKRARFRAGQTVVAKQINPRGHTRLPRYVRGRRGVVVRDHGVFAFPDSNAHGGGANPQHCYNVAFSAHELWGGSGRDVIHLDLWENYLEAPRGASRRESRR